MNCSELKMRQFIKTLTTGDFSHVGGKEVWEQIYNEYLGLRENKSSSYVLSLIKEIIYLKSKVFIIHKCVEILNLSYSRDLTIELKLCGCKGSFDFSNKVKYSAELRAAISFSKKYILQYERKEKELDDFYKKHGGDNITEKQFDEWQVVLWKFMGDRIDYDVISVSTFCILMNHYDRYCEVKNAEENNMIKETYGEQRTR